MIIGMGALPVTLVGNTIPSLQSRIFSNLMYETLAVLNEETGAIEPQLLDSMELVDDTTVLIKIKEGVQFHNGETLTAPGLAKSFELLRDSDPQKFTWSFRQLNDYESYEVIDDPHRIRLELSGAWRIYPGANVGQDGGGTPATT